MTKQKLNMGYEPFGGEPAREQFAMLAKRLAGEESTYELFKKDTGKDLKDLQDGSNKHLVRLYLEWFAIRFWGVECSKMEQHHVRMVHKLIRKVEESEESFIKSSKKEIKNHIGGSIIVIKNSGVVGVCLVKNQYIDTVVSARKGIATQMLSSLPVGRYKTHISGKNKRSLRFFGKFGFKYIKNEIVCGQERGLYAGEIKQKVITEQS